jgi:hypothetical protein
VAWEQEQDGGGVVQGAVQSPAMMQAHWSPLHRQGGLELQGVEQLPVEAQ